MTSDINGSPPYPPRLCRIVRTPDFDGYGFNLHTIRGKTGQFIGQVDRDSPAERSQLKDGDRIVEVNGVNITSENHKQVVVRIKLVPDETTLLVIDVEGDKWYQEHNIVITSSMTEVIRTTSEPSRRPSSCSSEERPVDRSVDIQVERPVDREEVDSATEHQINRYEDTASEDRRSVASASSSVATSDTSNRQSPMSTSPSPPSSVGAPSPTPAQAPAPAPAPAPIPTPTVTNNRNNNNNNSSSYNSNNMDGLNMNMTVAEMRAHLASKKKKDIRTNDMDLRQKYEIIQKL